MSRLTPENFIGDFHIAQDQNTKAEVQAYLDQHETDYLYKLFGVDLYALYNASNPLAPPYTVIHNPFVKQSSGSGGVFYLRGVLEHPRYGRATEPVIQQSYGILDMLKAFMYYHIMRDGVLTATPFGLKKQESEASGPAGASAVHKLDETYNRGVKSYKAIQWYMREYAPADYPLYNGDETIRGRYFGGAF